MIFAVSPRLTRWPTRGKVRKVPALFFSAHLLADDAADGFQNFIMRPSKGVRVIHGSGLGRWEQIWVARELFALGNQQVNRLLRESQRPHGVACFRRTDQQFSIDAVHLLRDGKRSIFNVQVRPKFSMHISN